MISRRTIRVKVMQTLYTISTFDAIPAPAAHASLLKQQFDQPRRLLVHLLWLLTEILRFPEKYAHQKASKHLPSAADLNINTKLAGNELLWQMLEDKALLKQIDQLKPQLELAQELIKSVYLKLAETETYQTYLSTPSRDKKAERKMVEYIVNDLLLANPSFVAYIEELFTDWDDDGEGVVQLLASYLHKPGQLNFEQLIDRDKEQFGVELLRTVLEKQEQLQSYIIPKLKNWDPERIAQLDMIMMKMGVAEFLFFETIPPKVTINEYIDLAKEYSTAQSGQFVNGILDGIHKDLVAAGALRKVDFRKS
ncbi:MAG: transcription antitermination factor NusB [Sphingomonadales bacterium]|nr:transcription antitermination factor NusB [Sphingomonadales bacterium]